MKFIGLEECGSQYVEPVRMKDLVKSKSFHQLSDSTWRLELHVGHDNQSSTLMDFVGPTKEDCLRQYAIWRSNREGNKIVRKGYSYKLFRAPDGVVRSLAQFYEDWLERNKLHGLGLSF